MSKKLVKTAKERFEERLRELTLMTSYQGVKDEKFYLCENEHKEMSILRDSKEYGFIEYKYQGGYQSMIDSEEFLYEMVCRFNEIGEPVKNIFNWYASADKDLTPFTVYDICQCMEYLNQLTFEDLYEEVPEVRIITAKEQWEKDSTNAKLAEQVKEDIYKVEVTESAIIFYIFKYNQYCKQWFPPLSELRKDAKFVTDYISYVRSTHDTDMEAALEWLAGREYTMSEGTLLDIYNIASCTEAIVYKDKSINEVAKQDFKKEMDAIRNKMVAHIEQLCEQGMTVNVEVLCQNVTLVCKDGSYIICEEIEDCWVAKNEKDQWSLYRKEYDGEWNTTIDSFSIDTLQYIIEALH